MAWCPKRWSPSVGMDSRELLHTKPASRLGQSRRGRFTKVAWYPKALRLLLVGGRTRGFASIHCRSGWDGTLGLDGSSCMCSQQ